MIYVDSSALVPLYVPESFSLSARAVIAEAKQVPFTPLHQLEIPNAFELLVGRRLMTRDQCRAILRQLEDDIESRRLQRVSLELEQVAADAADLARRFTSRFLVCSLDLLHVASAHVLLCKSFISADDRQLAVAKASGLSIIDIKRPLQRRRAILRG